MEIKRLLFCHGGCESVWLWPGPRPLTNGCRILSNGKANMQRTNTKYRAIDETHLIRTNKSNRITYVNRRHAVAIEPQSQIPVHGPTTAGRNLEKVMPFPASL
jgi:hypothetical protein